LKNLIILLLISAFYISCDVKSKQEIETIAVDEIVIPAIEKNRNDVKFTLKNGILLFDEKPFSGTVNQFYENGALKSISEYFEGKRQGKYFGFYPDKEKWFQRFYKDGLKVKVHTGWFPNGQQMFLYHFNNYGLYNGVVKDWHRNGILGKHFNFVDGKETGSQKMWNLKGKIRANFYTVNNERHGLIGLKNCVSVLTTETK
jgi:antitoxin component YwqK of YwqJK toxin-antitoxin module